MRVNRTIISVFACSLAIAGLAGCSSSGSSSKGGGGSSASALTIGMPDGPMTDNNNPYISSSAANQLGYRFMIYEPVALVNAAEPAQAPAPWLATGWTWANNYHSLTLTARTGVKFSDGTPMTAADIAYSFSIMKQYSALNTYALDITTVTTSGNSVTVNFGSSQFVHQDDVLSTLVVPKHIWSTMSNPATNTVADPIGTGPYTLTSFTPQTTTLTVRKSGYWQALPKVPKLLYTSYTANDAQTTALASGATQWSYVFIPDVQSVYEAKDPSHFKIWFPPTLSADGLWINTTIAPFNNVALRKAMSMVIDRSDIFTQGESGYFKPEVTSVTGLPTPAGNSFIAPQYQGQTASVNVAGAKSVLTAAGFTYSGSTLKDPSGKAVTINLTDPAGFSDYQTDLSIIQSNLASIGITASITKADENAWTTSFAAGNFQASMHWTNGGATPYDYYENIMDGADLLPVGNSKAVGNYGRFNDPAATAALSAYANASTTAARQTALNTLESIMINQVPMIPTSAGNVGAEYSTRNYVGWPSDANPYAGIQPTTEGALDVVLHLTPAK